MTDWHLLALTRPEFSRKMALADDSLKTIEAHGLALVLMPAPKIRMFAINPRADLARDLLNFQRQLETISAFGPLLPGAFEARLSDNMEALGFLGLNVQPLTQGLETWGHARQFELGFHWDMSVALLELSHTPAIQNARASGQVETLGKAIQDAVDEYKSELIQSWRTHLAELCDDLIDLPESAEDQVYHCVVLVRDEDALFSALEAFDESQPGLLKIKAMGPMPVVSFASIALETADTARLQAALSHIGASPTANVDELKSAFRSTIKTLHPDLNTLSDDSDRVRQTKADLDLLIHLAQHQAPLDQGPVMLAHLRRDGAAA